ncbi:hypothetical protein NEOKW01_1463 [Nematocida sp. AWRm80]|nr:hypothetical protein NEOKW01_1463 [Nematocida sp. AWRm80]
MFYFGVTSTPVVEVSEDIEREKEFISATESFAKIIQNTINIPLVIHPGQRIKSKKELKELESMVIQEKKPMRVSKKQSKKDRRKKAQVEEKVKSLMNTVDKKDGKHKTDKHSTKRPQKKQRPGKAKRQKVSHRG